MSDYYLYTPFILHPHSSSGENFTFTFKSIGRANFIQVGLEVSIYVLQH